MLTSHHNNAKGSPTALLDDVTRSAPTAPTAHDGPADSRSGGHVLVIGAPGPRRERLTRTLRSTGHEVSQAPPGEVERRMGQAQPDAIVALDEEGAHGARGARGLDVIREVRTVPAGRALPLLMVTARPEPAGVADMLHHGADDCIPEASDPVELSARIAAKLRRVPVPVENLPRDPRTGLYSHPHFLDELDRELQRPEAGRHGGVLAVVGVAEMAALEARLGQRVRREVAERLAGVAERLGSFPPAPRRSLQMVAKSAEHVTVPAGSVVVTEGAAGTEFFVILDGGPGSSATARRWRRSRRAASSVTSPSSTAPPQRERGRRLRAGAGQARPARVRRAARAPRLLQEAVGGSRPASPRGRRPQSLSTWRRSPATHPQSSDARTVCGGVRPK